MLIKISSCISPCISSETIVPFLTRGLNNADFAVPAIADDISALKRVRERNKFVHCVPPMILPKKRPFCSFVIGIIYNFKQNCQAIRVLFNFIYGVPKQRALVFIKHFRLALRQIYVDDIDFFLGYARFGFPLRTLSHSPAFQADQRNDCIFRLARPCRKLRSRLCGEEKGKMRSLLCSP